MIIDAHCHLDVLSYERANTVAVINAAVEDEWEPLIEAASADETVYPFLGLHPWFIDKAEDGWLDRLERRLEKTNAGVGEIGLDKFKGPSSDVQETVFRDQLDIARRLNRPVAVHCVKRWGLLLNILKNYLPHGQSVQLHRFNGNKQIMQELLSLGCMISFNTALFDNQTLAECWANVPIDRCLLETDAPDGLPDETPYSDALTSLYRRAAEIKGLTEKQLQETLRKNFDTFMG